MKVAPFGLHVPACQPYVKAFTSLTVLLDNIPELTPHRREIYSDSAKGQQTRGKYEADGIVHQFALIRVELVKPATK
jgi:hypothetical protein